MKQDWHTVQKDEPPVNRSLIIRPRINKERCKLELECIGGRTLSYSFSNEEEAQKAYDRFLGVSERKPAKASDLPLSPPLKKVVKAVESVNVTETIEDNQQSEIQKLVQKKHPLAKCKGCGERNHSCTCGGEK
jgi:hypothetical protein